MFSPFAAPQRNFSGWNWAMPGYFTAPATRKGRGAPEVRNSAGKPRERTARASCSRTSRSVREYMTEGMS